MSQKIIQIAASAAAAARSRAAAAGAAGLLLSLLASPAVGAKTSPADLSPSPAPSFLLSPVERELGSGEGLAALEEIYRTHVRSLDEAATFFRSPAFLRLGLAAQRCLLEAALVRDPSFFLGQTEFLPISLRAGYRQRALEAAAPVGVASASIASQPAGN